MRALDRDDGSVAAVLDAAEDHLNEVGAQVLAEVEAERRRQAVPLWKRVFRRKR